MQEINVEHIEFDGNKLLPAWFTERMMTDNWAFGLLMTSGEIIAIEHISGITQDATGNLWLDAILIPSTYGQYDEGSVNGHKLFLSPTSRTTISINSSHVVAAFELEDS